MDGKTVLNAIIMGIVIILDNVKSARGLVLIDKL